MADCAPGLLQARALEYARSCSASSHRRGQRAATRGVARLLTDACIEVTARSGTADELLVRVAEYPPDAVVGFAIGAVAILLAIPTQRLNIALLVALAFAVVASANLPALLYNLF